MLLFVQEYKIKSPKNCIDNSSKNCQKVAKQNYSKENGNNIINEMNEFYNDNYEDNKSIVEKVDKLLRENPDLRLGDELNNKYLAAKESVNNFKPENKGVVIGVSAGLAAAFSGLLYWIFKKESK